MLESINTLTASATPVATPPDVAATLGYLTAERIAFWERTDIARYSRWLTLRPDFYGAELADIAARRICDRPAIVWG